MCVYEGDNNVSIQQDNDGGKTGKHQLAKLVSQPSCKPHIGISKYRVNVPEAIQIALSEEVLLSRQYLICECSVELGKLKSNTT